MEKQSPQISQMSADQRRSGKTKPLLRMSADQKQKDFTAKDAKRPGTNKTPKIVSNKNEQPRLPQYHLSNRNH
jgi:hypothetical protein